MAKSRKQRMRMKKRGGGFWGDSSQSQSQNSLNSLTEDVKSSLSSLGTSISSSFNNLSNQVSNWVNTRKQNSYSQPSTNLFGQQRTMYGGKRRTHSKKHTKKRRTRRH
jgi:hypothetical protein